MNKIWQSKLKWHLLGWGIYFVINFYSDIFFEDWTYESSVFIFSYFAITVCIFYLFYSFVSVHFLQGNKLIFIPLFLLGALIFRYFTQEYFAYWVLSFKNFNNPAIWEFANDNFLKTLIPAAAGTLLFQFQKSKKDEAKTLKLLNEKNEAELSFLRSQINPHFLFNTLNFLYTKAFKLDEQLASSILNLSDVLRYTLKNSELEQVSIQEEIKLIEDLIEIFKARYNGSCYVNFTVDGDNLQQKFEPLMLMPFVENAFKHGIYNQVEHPISFSLQVKKGELIFKVENEIKHQIKDEVSGIGITNLQRRLDLMYPKNYELNINNNQITYKAELKINL